MWRRFFPIETVIFLGIWLVLLVIGRESLFRDPGTFWHVTTGQQILATGCVPRHDAFSFTRAGQPWVADQWMAECGMAIVHRAAGWDGLLLAAATILATIYTWLAMRLIRGGLHPLPALLTLALAMLAGAPQFHVRPLILTIGLFGATFAMLVDVDAGRRSRRQLWWLVPLFVFWSNVHGGVLAGWGTVALCILGWCVAWFFGKKSAVEQSLGEDMAARSTPIQSFRNVAELLLLLVALAVTMLISPYGFDLPRMWWETLSMPLGGIINEHGRLSFLETSGWSTVALAALYVIALLGCLPRWPRVSWLLPLVWLILAIQRVRNVPLLAVAVVIALADLLPNSRLGRWLASRDMFVARLSPPEKKRLADRLGWALPAVVVVGVFLIQAAGVALPVVGRGWARFDAARWPVELLPTLEEVNDSNPDGTPIFNDLNFGGFLIYHTPRLRVFVDDRCSLYGGDFLQAYDRARREYPAQIDRWQRQYGFRYALVETRGEFDRHLAATGDWAPLGHTAVATLYQRRPDASNPPR